MMLANKLRVKILLLFITGSQLVMAAPTPPGGAPPPCFPNPCIPIDQGDYLLIAVGILFATYFILKNKDNLSPKRQ